MYVETILPLPLYSTFTYSVPDDFASDVKVGSRVLVQFGKKKFYTALVSATRSDAPSGYSIKPIIAVLDTQPIIRYPQLKLWNWIAEYYLCSVGEVYKAAIPSGLKPESETFVSLNPDYEPDPENPYKPGKVQEQILSLIAGKKRISLSAIADETGISDVPSRLAPLLENEIVEVAELLTDRYRPLKKTFVTPTFSRHDSEALKNALEKVSRSQLQERLILAWLDTSGWLNHKSQPIHVEKSELLAKTGVSSAILNALVKKGIFSLSKRSVNRFYDLAESSGTEISVSPLSEAQKIAYKNISEGFRNNSVQLLHGVTGSGKTEIYTHLIADCLKAGNQALFLVPEISLTTQLTRRLKAVFGNRLLVYHSKFSDSERVDIWKRLLQSVEPLVILGVRSSVFLPFARLGLIIVDEEHESSFKQYDPAPRYNARDVALMLATYHGAKTLLGSATPAVETYYKALSGKYGLVTLSERFDGAVMPDVEIVNMREARKQKDASGIISGALRRRLTSTLSQGRQAILFQNRRGFAPVVICNECGWSPHCHNCDVSLIYHKKISMLRCHYCGFSTPLPPLCPACGQNAVSVYGYGTERISEDVAANFPEAKVARMDLDTTRNKNAYSQIIDDFAEHKTDILVGTQMVSKGLDFGDVTTVGILNADTLLNYPHFRSNERAFNMMEQVAGRAGRRRDKGSVLIQTVKPDSPVLNFVKNHDYVSFYKSEIADREKYLYPPFTKVIIIYIKNRNSESCDAAAVEFTLALRKVFGNRVLGPEKPFVSRIAGHYLQTIMLKVESGASMKKVKDLLRSIYASIATSHVVKSSIVYYDVDPV